VTSGEREKTRGREFAGALEVPEIQQMETKGAESVT